MVFLRAMAEQTRGLWVKWIRLLTPPEGPCPTSAFSPLTAYTETFQPRGTCSSSLCLSDLEPLHCALGSSLHRGADQDQVTTSAFLYSVMRLPECMEHVDCVLLASSRQALERAGVDETWVPVKARARRRPAWFNGKSSLAFLIHSVSDLDDLIPALCAVQIEWNKMHRLLAESGMLSGTRRRPAQDIRRVLGLNSADFHALRTIWAPGFHDRIQQITRSPKSISLRLTPMESADYHWAASKWWSDLLGQVKETDLGHRPVYLVSSNTHCLPNLISGSVDLYGRRFLDHALAGDDGRLARRVDRLMDEGPLALRNLMYYSQRGFLEENTGFEGEKGRLEAEAGLTRLNSVPLDVSAQIIEIGRLMPDRLDPRLTPAEPSILEGSDALILNIDYPLGFTAYYLLKQAAVSLKNLRGLFILGKTAAMIGRLGDLLLPAQVMDVHSHCRFHFRNCFTARRIIPYLYESAVFDDQRNLTVRGTFLHSWNMVKDFHRADFTGIEMEAGPCLSAVYEHFHGQAPASNSNVDLALPQGFDLGIIHYTSDTPYNLRASLLSQRLGLNGVEATYAGGLAILQFILDRETRRITGPTH